MLHYVMMLLFEDATGSEWRLYSPKSNRVGKTEIERQLGQMKASETARKRGIAVLICGGREFGQSSAEIDAGFKQLDLAAATLKDHGINVTRIIHGGARGADKVAEKWARSRGFKVETFYPDWHKFGKSASYRRNEVMLKTGKPSYVIAFPGESTTNHMVRISEEAGVSVWKPTV